MNVTARKAAAILLAIAMVAAVFSPVAAPLVNADQNSGDQQNNNWNNNQDSNFNFGDNQHNTNCDSNDHHADSNDCGNQGDDKNHGDNNHGHDHDGSGDNGNGGNGNGDNGNGNGGNGGGNGGGNPPPAQTGSIAVKNVVVGGTATPNMFTFSFDGFASTSFNASGENDFFGKTLGSYNISETSTSTYSATYSNCQGLAVTANATSTCTVTNTFVQPAPVIIDASSVVCTNPADLPNWGATGHPAITSTSAKDWVAAHVSCSLTPGWSFEYADQTAAYGGDATIGHVNGYTAFGPTGSTGSTTISFPLGAMLQVQVREQLQSGFIPFTYTSDNTNSTVPSAQMYCANDVLNYDNTDFVKAPLAGSTYYCVSFNSPQVVTPVVTTNAAPANTSGGGGGGTVISGPLSIGFVTTNTSGNTNTGGVVLGTSTVAADNQPAGCSALLTTYMRAGKHNDASEVKKLQIFLNAQLGLSIPVTGFFGTDTTSAVNAFQVKHQDDVLMPWAPFGLDGHTPTGYVYKTTQHEINSLSCASLNMPAPQLP